MNKIWLILLTVAVGVLLFIDPPAVMKGAVAGSNEAVKLTFSLLAVYAFWLGILNILEETGVSAAIAKALGPVIRLIFGKSLKPETKKYVSMNMSANLLGLGNAATPMGIAAVKSMDEGNGKKATLPMIMLVVISATSLQLIPTTVIGMRAAHNSAAPADFLPACLAATILSTVLGIIAVKIYGLFLKRGQKPKA